MTSGARDSTLSRASTAIPRVHFPALDGYRALAALAVLVNHVAILSGLIVRKPGLGQFLVRADVGVSIFFLLSGFLLYRPFVAARLAGGPRPAYGAFLRRRVFRIIPGYWFALTIVAFVLRAPPFTEGHSVVLHYLLLQIYATTPIAEGQYQITGGPIQQSWSLATEVSFYLFLPLWAWLMTRRQRESKHQIRVEFLGLAVMWAAAIGLKVAVLLNGTSAEHFGLYSAWLPFRLDEFALGMTLAVLSAWWAHSGTAGPKWLQTHLATMGCWALAGLIFWLTCTQLDLPLSPLFSARQAFVVRLLYSFTALFLLIPAVLGRRSDGPVKALFQNPTMVWLGLISFGIYIWHEAWQDKYLEWFDQGVFTSPFWSMLAVTSVLTVASAAFSWYVVERFALRFKTPCSGRRVPGGD